MTIHFGNSYVIEFQPDPIQHKTHQPEEDLDMLHAKLKKQLGQSLWLDPWDIKNSVYTVDGDCYLFTNGGEKNSHKEFQQLLKKTGVAQDMMKGLWLLTQSQAEDQAEKSRLEDLKFELILNDLMTYHEDILTANYAYVNDQWLITNIQEISEHIKSAEAE